MIFGFKIQNKHKSILCGALAGCLLLAQGTVSKADTIDQLKNQLAETQKELNALTGQEMSLEGKKDAVEEELEEMDLAMVQLISSIDLLEEEIAAKVVEVQRASDSLDAAMQTEREQYEAMKIRIRFMYEHGDYSYVQLLLEAGSISDLMNKADYIERLYEYDRELLIKYQEIVEEVALLKEKLEEEQAALEAEEFELKEEQEALEEAMDEKRSQVDDYDSQIAELRSVSSQYTALVRQQKSQIQQLEAEEAARREAERKAREEAERRAREEAERQAKANSQSGSDSQSESSSESKTTKETEKKSTSAAASQAISSIGSASGSAKGKELASFACQFVGNPYVPGGTSLTNGADCSGFTQSVFKNFGVSLPRNSASQREVGSSVSYSDAQPGDIVCYPGHVGIYIGNGNIVHASTQKTGIKISPATYREILSIRRVL